MVFSFVTSKDSCNELELLQTAVGIRPTQVKLPPSDENTIEMKILYTSLSANNKFYLGFGDSAPFYFFKCFPVPSESKLIGADDEKPPKGQTFVHPPAWGLCQVTKSPNKAIPVGSVYRGMLPIADQVLLDGTTTRIEASLDNLIVDRPATNPSYNAFVPIAPRSVCHPSSPHAGLALACYPGILTGFGLYFTLERANFYDCQTVVITSASSKVALALALYLKEHKAKDINVVGYTSKGNKDFCKSTGLYSDILMYDESLPDDSTPVVMVDICGRSSSYVLNQRLVKKLLCIGNASGAPNNDGTMSTFSIYATLKLLLGLFGAPLWIRNLMNPSQELFLVLDAVQVLQQEWGKEKYLEQIETYSRLFCENAGDWIHERECTTTLAIQTAFQDIVGGKVVPSECVLLDVGSAVKDMS